MPHPVSPLAVPLPELAPIKGMRLAVGEAGIRYKGRPDVLFAECVPGTIVAGAFTRNRCPGAPVDWCRHVLRMPGGPGGVRALVVNAGNANVFTGRAGREACARTAAAAAKLLGCRAQEVLLASTGVIGQTLPDEKITAILPELHKAAREDHWGSAAKAIMTTDTFPKGASRTARIGGKSVRITGIAKGSGMIAPDMATMLCFVATDAQVPPQLLDRMLKAAVVGSFNCTTVDSDTSTSDTVLLFATGQAAHPRVTLQGRDMLDDFGRALNEVLMDLALGVVRDGEGAQKLIRIDVSGARSADSAKRVALAIANSPLVKTAIAGEDANWGRVVMAIGKSGEAVNRDRVSVAMGGVWMARDGTVVDGYDEAPVVKHIKGREVHVEVGLGGGRGTATVYTCDLTHGYIDINGSYRS
jgi:glutamate N-acetyltransferase/amino-acid N-acetyltransferase